MNNKDNPQEISWIPVSLLAWASMLALPLCGFSAALTGPQVLERSRAAYNSLKSCQCDTVASSSMTSRGTTVHEGATARIRFDGPDWIRVDGTFSTTGGQGFSDTQPYAFVSDGKTTELYMFGDWSRIQSPDMAIASATGVAVHAATLVPSLLLRSSLVNSFYNPQEAENEVSSQTVDGHSCYKVTINYQYKSVYWIDKNTWLIVKSYEDLSSIAAAKRLGAGAMSITVDFRTTAIDRPVPATVFVMPKATAASPFSNLK